MPVTVRGYVPVGVLVLVWTVSVELVPVVGSGLKEYEPPLGSPLALRSTADAKPPVREMVTV